MTPPFDLATAHRHFAVELNNLVWDALEDPDREAEGLEPLVHAAHASLHHWLQVGGPAQHQRGLVLLTSLYAALGRPGEAARHARAALALTSAHAAELEPFDAAIAHAAAGQALALGGDEEEAEAAELTARAAGLAADLDDAERALLERLYGAGDA